MSDASVIADVLRKFYVDIRNVT